MSKQFSVSKGQKVVLKKYDRFSHKPPTVVSATVQTVGRIYFIAVDETGGTYKFALKDYKFAGNSHYPNVEVYENLDEYTRHELYLSALDDVKTAVRTLSTTNNESISFDTLMKIHRLLVADGVITHGKKSDK